MLEHLEAKGVKAPYSCREGECSACAVRLLEGEVEMAHNDVLDEEDLAEGIRLGCQAVPVTDTVRVTSQTESTGCSRAAAPGRVHGGDRLDRDHRVDPGQRAHRATPFARILSARG